jgi:hypothetical protein
MQIAAAAKDTKEMITLPESWVKFISENFKADTVRCIYRSHDVLNILRTLNIGSIWDVSPSFKTYAASNFLYLS